MDYQLITALSPLLSTIAGGLIGFLSARLMWGFQLRKQRQNIAQGLLLEIESMEKMLTGWRNILRKPPFPGAVKIDTPLYPNHGLYYQVQRELFAFDQDLAADLFRFYVALVHCEQMRESRAPEDKLFAFTMEGVKAGIDQVVDQLPALKTQLMLEIERSNWDRVRRIITTARARQIR